VRYFIIQIFLIVMHFLIMCIVPRAITAFLRQSKMFEAVYIFCFFFREFLSYVFIIW